MSFNFIKIVTFAKKMVDPSSERVTNFLAGNKRKRKTKRKLKSKKKTKRV